MSEGQQVEVETGELKISGEPFEGALLSVPESMLYHAVEDGELERLMALARPISIIASLTAGGIFIGTLPQAIAAVIRLAKQGGAIDASLASYLVVCFVMLAVAVCTGVVALTGKSAAQKALEAIRQRPKIPLPRGHPAAPPPKD
ncbi:MAG: hypothetical protein ACFCUQ_12625 [Kiloniellales bacterium]